MEEELGVRPEIEFILGTTHFYRGPASPETDLLGMAYACTIPTASAIQLSAEHDAHHWFTTTELVEFLPENHWLLPVVARAEFMRQHWPEPFKAYFAERPFDLS